MYQPETVHHTYTVPTLTVITFIGGGHWEEGFSVGDVLLNILSSRLSPLLPSVHPHQTKLHCFVNILYFLYKLHLLCKQPILSIEMVTTICAGKCWLLLVTNGQWVYLVCVCVCVCVARRAHSNLLPHTLESQMRDTNGFIAILESF